MSTDLILFEENQIVVKQGTIEFNGFERLKEEALQLSEQIEKVEVTDENIQASKKMLAAVNKRVKEMENRRIAIKKDMLAPYEDFEKQVKEIVSIVKTADGTVRQQVKDLEERGRMVKETKLAEIFVKRIRQYDSLDAFNFQHFIKPQHLNKSSSLKSVEAEMVEWLEKKEADMKVISSLPKSHDVLMEYLDTKDLSIAINIVNEREERKKQLEHVVPVKKAVEKVGQAFVITLTDEKDLLLVEMFMKQNNINYKTEKVAN